MRGLIRWLLYASVAVAILWTGSVAYQRITRPAGGNQASAAGTADAMGSAIWAP